MLNDSAAQQAQRVANHIKDLLEGSERDHFGHDINAGDILILLRRRDHFHALLRSALTRAHIPVAGADRIMLNDQIEILDMLALADLCLLPEDDLALACLLRSPLIGMSEESLFQLAHPRKGTLFEALFVHDGADNEFSRAAAKIRHWRNLSGHLSVFEFFSMVLSGGGRAAFHQRLGHNVDDSLNHFLHRAREDQQMADGQVGLSDFVNSIRADMSEVTRDLDIHEYTWCQRLRSTDSLSARYVASKR